MQVNYIQQSHDFSLARKGQILQIAIHMSSPSNCESFSSRKEYSRDFRICKIWPPANHLAKLVPPQYLQSQIKPPKRFLIPFQY